MIRRYIYFYITALLIIAIIIATRSSAKAPSSVGNRAAPVSKLEIKDTSLTSTRFLSKADSGRSIASSIGSKTAFPLYDLTEYQMKWFVTVEDGTMQPVMAQVFVPIGKDDQDFPMIVYAPGSTGLDDRCAPSREDLRRGNMGNYRNYMIAQASQGYIVVMPNYEGFDNPNRNPHYFNKDSEARTVLSSAKALIDAGAQIDLPYLSGALFFGGYSQGGHSAFSAADYADTFTPDMHIAGILGHGPTTDIFDLLKSNPNLAAYFIASYNEYYPVIDPTKVLTPTWVGYLDKARKICVNEGFSVGSTNIQSVFTKEFGTALKNNTLRTAFPTIYSIFMENNAGTSYVKIPTMIAQGTTDPIVTDSDQKNFVRQLCRRGVPVDLKEYPRVHHFATREVAFRDTNAWINAVSRGEAVNNSCSKL